MNRALLAFALATLVACLDQSFSAWSSRSSCAQSSRSGGLRRSSVPQLDMPLRPASRSLGLRR